MLDRQDIREESPFFADDLLGGLECATDSTVNPYLLAFALLAESKKFGTKAFNHTEVKEMKKRYRRFIYCRNDKWDVYCEASGERSGCVGSENWTNVGCKYPN